MSDEALSSVGLLVPDIMDYSNKNKILDFNKDVDKQFFDMIKLSDEEVLYIKDIVNNSRGGK
jgi:hypothetical protein